MHYNTNITYTNMTKGLRHTRLTLNLLSSQGRLNSWSSIPPLSKGLKACSTKSYLYGGGE